MFARSRSWLALPASSPRWGFQRRPVMTRCDRVRLCAGFRMPANTNHARTREAGVQKAQCSRAIGSELLHVMALVSPTSWPLVASYSYVVARPAALRLRFEMRRVLHGRPTMSAGLRVCSLSSPSDLRHCGSHQVLTKAHANRHGVRRRAHEFVEGYEDDTKNRPLHPGGNQRNGRAARNAAAP